MPKYRIEMITTLSVTAKNKEVAMLAAKFSEGHQLSLYDYGLTGGVKPFRKIKFRFLTNKKTESQAAQYLQTVDKGLIVDERV